MIFCDDHAKYSLSERIGKTFNLFIPMAIRDAARSGDVEELERCIAQDGTSVFALDVSTSFNLGGSTISEYAWTSDVCILKESQPFGMSALHLVVECGHQQLFEIISKRLPTQDCVNYETEVRQPS